MDLARSCEEGQIGIEEFCELLFMRPRRTHFLNIGDYVVSTYFGKEDVLKLERIAKLNYPEKGDFVTTRGSIGPINGNVFIKIQPREHPEYLLIEGDRIGEPTCPTPVYDRVNKHCEGRVKAGSFN